MLQNPQMKLASTYRAQDQQRLFLHPKHGAVSKPVPSVPLLTDESLKEQKVSLRLAELAWPRILVASDHTVVPDFLGPYIVGRRTEDAAIAIHLLTREGKLGHVVESQGMWWRARAVESFTLAVQLCIDIDSSFSIGVTLAHRQSSNYNRGRIKAS